MYLDKFEIGSQSFNNKKQYIRDEISFEELHKAKSDNTPSIVTLKDPDNRFRFVNKTPTQTTVEEVIGRLIFDFITEEQGKELEY